MKKLMAFIVAAALLTGQAFALETLTDDDISVAAPCAVLMERSTGTVLYEKQSHARCSPASVTKVMTMLLAAEAVDDGRLALTDTVTVSRHAASMGGSQVWLEEGERMTVSEMLKCVAVVSANDCAVALAEHIAGSEEAFVKRMNERAAELGLADTHFTNCTGLHDDDDHYSSAYDIAVMSRALLAHAFIRDYTTIWMDTIRDGAFGLSNTNKLVRRYEGATGLKTGFTSKAMYCLAASAERDGIEYIAVVLHADTSADRFDSAETLLSYAFANYTLVSLRPEEALPPVPVALGARESVQPVYSGPEALVTERETLGALAWELDVAEAVEAPVAEGQTLGSLTVRNGDAVLAEAALVSPEAVPRLTAGDIWLRMLGSLAGKPFR